MSSESMPAVLVQMEGRRGAWNSLVLGTAPLPVLASGEVLVQVEACSVNRADLLQRRGLYPAPPETSEILGLDYAGFLAVVPPEIREWNVGDRVFGIVPGGAYARYVKVPAEHLLPVPANLSFVEAAAAAEVFIAAHLNLFRMAELKPSETLLIHGGGSGVGTAAIQLAKTSAARVIITVGTDEKAARCLEMGADFGINYRTQDFEDRVMELTGGMGVDVVLDWIGAAYLEKHLRCLKTGGRLVLMGLMGGSRAEIPLDLLVSRRLRLIGSVLRSRSSQERGAILRDFAQTWLPRLKDGTVKPTIDRVFDIRDVEVAHQLMRDSLHFGKLVLVWSPPSSTHWIPPGSLSSLE